MNVFYLCDGEVERCKKTECYKTGGKCRHTNDIEHAVNFKPSSNKHSDNFWEKDKEEQKESGRADKAETTRLTLTELP